MDAEQTNETKPVWKPSKSAKTKQGIDRRMKVKSKKFDENMHKKMAGEEIPKTLKVS